MPPNPGRFRSKRRFWRERQAHVELAVGMFGMFVEVTGAKQTATACFHVVSFHSPGGAD